MSFLYLELYHYNENQWYLNHIGILLILMLVTA